MKKTVSLIAAAFISASGLLSAAAISEIKSFSGAGLSIQAIEVPRPAGPALSETRNNQQNMALKKIKLIEGQVNMNDTLTVLIDRHMSVDKAVGELKEGGFKARAAQTSQGRSYILVDAAGIDAADAALGLAKYYYVIEVRVGKTVYDALFAVKSKSAYAVRIGTIKGGMNYTPVDLTLNKINWTIKGGINYAPVDVKIDHEAKTVTGGVNYSPVELKFAWSPEEVTMEGGANHSPVKYTVNWKNGVLEGYANYSPLKLEFDMQEGIAGATSVKVTGYVNYAPVSLTYDKISGWLEGGMNLKPVGIDLVNCDLYDFLTYFFVFMK